MYPTGLFFLTKPKKITMCALLTSMERGCAAFLGKCTPHRGQFLLLSVLPGRTKSCQTITVISMHLYHPTRLSTNFGLLIAEKKLRPVQILGPSGNAGSLLCPPPKTSPEFGDANLSFPGHRNFLRGGGRGRERKTSEEVDNCTVRTQPPTHPKK